MTTQMRICSGFFEWLHNIKSKLKSLFSKSEDEELEDPYISKLTRELDSNDDGGVVAGKSD